MVKKRGLFAVLIGGIISVSMLGTAFAAPIDLQIGCRPQAMGGAFVAVADDINAGYWNPAGLKLVTSKGFSFMHSNPFSIPEISLDYVAFVSPDALPWMKGALGLSYLKVGARLTEGPGNLTTNPGEENYYTLSIGSVIWEDSLYYGVNVKAIDINLGDEGKRSGMGFDFGLLWKINEFFSAGMMMRNLAAHLGNENFPLEKRFGVAGRFLDGRLVVAADYNSKKEVESQRDYWGPHFGVEYRIIDSIALRVGSDRGDLTAGVGFDFGGTGKAIPTGTFNYTYAKNEAINYTHRLSVALFFE